MRWLERYRGWRRRRRLERVMMDPLLWSSICDAALRRYQLDAAQLEALRQQSSLFLDTKVVNGARGFVPDDYQRGVIAATACLLILELDLSWYDGWIEVIVYPDAFVTRHEYVDEAGVVHRDPSVREGESWDQGPVILSWADLRPDRRHPEDPTNLVIHEFAHKLDQLNGIANGKPPLHKGMDHRRWTAVLQAAFNRLQHQLERDQEPLIDPYAADSPAEFFAVVSEYFFEAPDDLAEFDTALYEQLRQFYRQDPLRRAS